LKKLSKYIIEYWCAELKKVKSKGNTIKNRKLRISNKQFFSFDFKFGLHFG